MKKIVFVIIAILFSTPIFAENLVEGTSGQTMDIVYFDNFPPYSWANKDGKMQGILIDVLDEAIGNRMGINITHKGYPWARAQSNVKTGNADAFVTVPTDERREYTKVSQEPVIISTFTLFINNKNIDPDRLKYIKKVEDLKGYEIGHYRGSGWAKEKFAGMKVDLADTLDSTLKKLARGRFDVFVDTSQVVRYRIKELGLKEEITEVLNIID